MASPGRSKKPRRKVRTRGKALAAASGPAVFQTIRPSPAQAGADLFELMGNMMARCAELPMRLLRARSPLEIWQEQVLFIQSVSNAYRQAALMTVMPPATTKKSKAKTRKRG
jgi:hypothetical protein